MKNNCRCIMPFKTAMTTLVIMWLLSLPTPIFASEYYIDAGYTWSEPVDGSPVVHYVVEHSINGGVFIPVAEVPTNSCRVLVAMDGFHQIRVAGVDAFDQQGVWSESSEIFNPVVMPVPPPEYVNGYLGALSIVQDFPLITGDAYLDSIQVVECYPGGTLGGDIHLLAAKLTWMATGLNEYASFKRQISIALSGEIHTSPRDINDSTQSFETAVFRLHGTLSGDADFDEFRITIGSDFNLPSTGFTTLSEMNDGSFVIDSFFDLNYQIEYLAHDETLIEGLGGTTTGTEHFKALESRHISDALDSQVPAAVTLFQNSPNPFNPLTIIRYEIPMASTHVSLDVFDIRGSRVRTLMNETQMRGEKTVAWNGTDSSGQQVPAGIYFYKLVTSQGSLIRKMALVK